MNLGKVFLKSFNLKIDYFLSMDVCPQVICLKVMSAGVFYEAFILLLKCY